jgi:hypothetical protein
MLWPHRLWVLLPLLLATGDSEAENSPPRAKFPTRWPATPPCASFRSVAMEGLDPEIPLRWSDRAGRVGVTNLPPPLKQRLLELRRALRKKGVSAAEQAVIEDDLRRRSHKPIGTVERGPMSVADARRGLQMLNVDSPGPWRAHLSATCAESEGAVFWECNGKDGCETTLSLPRRATAMAGGSPLGATFDQIDLSKPSVERALASKDRVGHQLAREIAAILDGECRDCRLPPRAALALAGLSVKPWKVVSANALGASFDVNGLAIAVLCDSSKSGLGIGCTMTIGNDGCIASYNAHFREQPDGLVYEQHLELCEAQHGDIRIRSLRDRQGAVSSTRSIGGSLLGLER